MTKKRSVLTAHVIPREGLEQLIRENEELRAEIERLKSQQGIALVEKKLAEARAERDKYKTALDLLDTATNDADGMEEAKK